GSRALVTEQVTLLLPPGAQGILQLWFRIEAKDGRVWWDSDGGRNHLVEVMPGAEVFLSFEGVAASPR
ncbi:MAG: hypothetical protein ACO3JL_00140, partial [Myxococcota bacterium]